VATRDEIADAIYNAGDDLGSKAAARRVVALVFDQIGKLLEEEDEVTIPGFGKFKCKVRPEREGRNPHSGEMMTFVAKRVVSFKPGSVLKTRVDN